MTAATQALAFDPVAEHRPLLGDLAIWVFILAELAAFAVLFVLYGVARFKHAALFNAMQPRAAAPAVVTGFFTVLTINVILNWKG